MSAIKSDREMPFLSTFAILGYGLFLFVRWPFAPMWMQNDWRHDSHNMSAVGEARLCLLCTAAVQIEVATVLLFAAWLIGFGMTSLVLAILGGLAFFAMSGVRYWIWMENIGL